MTKHYFLLFAISLCVTCGHAQDTANNNWNISIAGGQFKVGKAGSPGIWTGIDFRKRMKPTGFASHLKVGGELYFESGQDSAKVVNPTYNEFIHQRFFHESNTALAATIIYYPLKGWIQGLHIGIGPLIEYSQRTYEVRAQSEEIVPGYVIRMSQMHSDNHLLAGYHILVGYDINFAHHWLAGLLAESRQSHSRDLNSVLGIKVGYRF